MGLFDRFKKKEEPKVERDIAYYSKKLPDGISEIEVDGLSRIQKFRHRDNSETSLILGRIETVEGNNAFMIDSADYIAFELPIGQKITEEAILAAIDQYNIDKASSVSESKSFYVGQIENGKVIKKSAAVQKYVDDTVSSIEQNREMQYKQKAEERRKAEEAAREKQRIEDEKRRKEYEEIQNRDRTMRKNNPELKSAGKFQIQGIELSDYDGVDMIKGDILRLRQVNKLCKDIEGTYLYSAYVSKVQHKYDAEILGNGEPAGDYICFTLPERLEDIVQRGDRNQITTVLELLSDERTRSGELTYIGGIDRSGQISRDSFPKSSALANRVAQMQQAYSMKKQQSMRRESYNSYDDGR